MMKKLAALSLALLLAACGGGDGGSGPGGSGVSLRLEADTVRPGALLRVYVEGAEVTTDVVEATLGGTAMTLVRASDSVLVGYAPEIAAGSRTLAIALGTNTPQATVNVLAAAAIANPQATIATFLEAPLLQAPVAAPVGYTTAQWSEMRARVDSLVQEAKAEVAGLPAADQLALARILASLGTPPTTQMMSVMSGITPVDATGTAIFGDGACGNAKARVTRFSILSLYGLGGLLVFIAAPPVNPLLKVAGIATMAASFAGTTLLLVTAWPEMAANCVVNTTVDATETDQYDRLLALTQLDGTTASQAAGPKRFYRNIGVAYYTSGMLRPLSTAEIAKDAIVAKLSATVDELHADFNRLVNRLPAAVRRKIPALPPRLAPPVAGRIEELPASAVRIENVSPSTVQLAMTGAQDRITLTTGATVTTEVPFTYDLVSVYDATVRKTMSGVARPFMSATVAPYEAEMVGTRTIVPDANANLMGVLTCSGSPTIRIRGGEQGEWETFAWTMSGPVSISETEPIRTDEGARVVFEEGDFSPGGSWYTSFNENGQPVWKSFTVRINISFRDLLTGEIKNVPAITVTCI
jgi:hypothetical protein